MRRHFILLLMLTVSTGSLIAREEVVLTIPKSGTHYLRVIIESITDYKTVQPTVPEVFEGAYHTHLADETMVVMGHCEPLMLHALPQKEPILLLVRDPRDLALSAVDYINNCGLEVWPGLSTVMDRQQWGLLSKKEKLALIVNDFYDDRRMSIINLFETAVTLTQKKSASS